MSAIPVSDAVAWLLRPEAIRERCGRILAAADAGRSDHFTVARDKLPALADFVTEEIRGNYPDLKIPYHSRWRHFAAGGRDRWGALAARLGGLSANEMARMRIDLALTSVLLDAGAGPAWRYREADGTEFSRSEGLAVASFVLFERGILSGQRDWPLRADAAALRAFTADNLAQAFQVTEDNPLEGLEGRAGLLNRLGRAVAKAPQVYGESDPRVGNLYDYLVGLAGPSREVPAPLILATLLETLGSIWPGRIVLDGVNLGDVWRHPAAGDDGLVPFHKLSQWLTYSLVEPLVEAGLAVTDIEALTGLAEYRNGGLMIDGGLLCLKDPAALAARHAVDSELIVEWRALTLALLDPLAAEVRERLGQNAAELPLAKVLEGGTWSAGRRIAREKRPDGDPPLTIVSDGTVF
ncbi:MAG: URC4/urg3 family protein [Pseudomonadota bacterium]